MVNAHKPMVVAVEFAIEDFVVDDFPNKDLAFFFDRNVFVKLLNDGVGPAWFLGYYAPRRLWRGHEYRATKAILPERIRHVLFPKTSSDRRFW
jgi:hypothetical protein